MISVVPTRSALIVRCFQAAHISTGSRSRSYPPRRQRKRPILHLPHWAVVGTQGRWRWGSGHSRLPVVAAVAIVAVSLAACGGTSKAAAGSSTTAQATVTRTMVPGIPTLGQAVGNFFASQGFGRVRPTTFSNGGDPTGQVTAITWNSWGSLTAAGSGTGYWVGPNQVVAGASPEPVTIVAFNRETCAGKPMYGAVEWYFPEHGEHFDPNNYEDICTGQYVDLACLSYQRATELLQSGSPARGDVADGVMCKGPSWAMATIQATYFSKNTAGIPIGSATFHRERGGQWVVSASFVDRHLNPLLGPPSSYCRTLVRKGAPPSLRCAT
jgi:hypothetical protein